jgi:hypothetical protein
MNGKRLTVLLLAIGVFLVSSACTSLTKQDKEPGLVYSGAFATWFYQTNQLSIEAGQVQVAMLEDHDDEGIRARLRELATTQFNLNEQFARTPPHAFWKDYHPAIVAATERFDDATAELRGDDDVQALGAAADVFKANEDTLLQVVINCYTQTKSCEKP